MGRYFTTRPGTYPTAMLYRLSLRYSVARLMPSVFPARVFIMDLVKDSLDGQPLQLFQICVWGEGETGAGPGASPRSN